MCCSHFISSNGTTLCISNNAINQYLLKTYFELIRSFINTIWFYPYNRIKVSRWILPLPFHKYVNKSLKRLGNMPRVIKISGTTQSSILDHCTMPPSMCICRECCALLYCNFLWYKNYNYIFKWLFNITIPACGIS